MPTETFAPVFDGTVAADQFTAETSQNGAWVGSPTLEYIKDVFLAGEWTLVGKTYAEGQLFIRELPWNGEEELPDELKTDPPPCGLYYMLTYAFNGVPRAGSSRVPFDPKVHKHPPPCPYWIVGEDFIGSMMNLISTIPADTPFEVIKIEQVPGYAHGYLITIRAKQPGPQDNWYGFDGNGYGTAVYQQPQNGGYVFESQRYKDDYLRVIVRENAGPAPAHIWFDISLGDGSEVFSQPIGSNQGHMYRMVASPHQFGIWVPGLGATAGSAPPTVLFASVPWRPDNSPASGCAFAVGNWNNRFQFTEASFRQSLGWAGAPAAVSVEGEPLAHSTGITLCVPSLHTVPGAPVQNIQKNSVTQNAFITARRNDGTHDTEPLRILGKLWNCMVLSKHFDVTETDLIRFNQRTWMLLSSQDTYQQGSLWLQAPEGWTGAVIGGTPVNPGVTSGACNAPDGEIPDSVVSNYVY